MKVYHGYDAYNTTTERNGQEYRVGYVSGWFFTWAHGPDKYGWRKLTRRQKQDIVDTLEVDENVDYNGDGDVRAASRGAAERELRHQLQGL